jgi:hypothetical protein
VQWGSGVSEVADLIDTWRESGASHVNIDTMGAGFTSLGQHLDALEAVAERVLT